MAKNYYEVLGVSKEASNDEIRKAFREKMMKSHPDVNKSADATSVSQDLSEAWSVLKDDEKRRAYDQTLSRPERTKAYNGGGQDNSSSTVGSTNDANSKEYRNNYDAFRNNPNNNSSTEPSDNLKEPKNTTEWAKQEYAQEGPDALDNEDLSPEERRALKKERAIESNAQALDDASAYLKDANINPIVTAVANVHYYASKYDPKFRRDRAKETYYLNKFAPFSQGIINKAAESGATKKAGEVLALKNGDASKAGEKAASDKAADEATKKLGDGAAAAVSKESSENFSIMNILKNPLFWILGGASLFFTLIIIIVLISSVSNSSGSEYHDQFPYVKMEFSENIKVKIGNDIYDLTLDEATAAVLDHEDTPFTDNMEYLKARAIASRSRILYEMNESSYKSRGYYVSDGNLGFRITSKNSKFQKAADETSGVILISGSISTPKFYRAEWDSFTHKSSCGGSETNSSFILCQKHVEVPFSFLKKHFYVGIDWFRNRTGHGRGMSQHGAYYLAVDQGYDAVKLLNHFYSGKTIISLYPKSSSVDNTNVIPNINGECVAIKSIRSTPGSAKRPSDNLKSLLKNKGTTVSSFNNGLLNAVLEAGSGTRCAVVTAAIYSIKNLSSYGYRIPYSQPGYSVTSYGISGSWGTKRCNSCKYDRKGLDCGTFVQWAFYNGGVNLGFNQFKNKGKNVGYTEGKPGDVMYHTSTDGRNGHVVLILKYNKSKKGYYVAQAAGKTAGDTKINFVSVTFLKNNNYKVKDMSSYYCEKSGCGKSKTKSNSQLKKAFN